MHLKNFSMIDENDQWKFSPAYDLLNASIVNPKDTEELALNLDGKKKKFTKHNFENFGKNLGLNDKQIAGVFKRMIAQINHLPYNGLKTLFFRRNSKRCI
jgi:serine/threonine-protein kinase HipA